jgi:acetyl-CoA synthetase
MSVAWYPTPDIVENANWTSFIRHCGLRDYPALEQFALQDAENFWRQLADWLGFRFIKQPLRMLDLSSGIEHPQWCIGGTTNLYVNTLGRAARERPAQSAIIWQGEDGRERCVSYAALDGQAERLAAGLDALGLGIGDVIAFYMPMLPETAAAFMACVRLGCIVLPLFSGFGTEAIAQRLELSGAKAVFTVPKTQRRGQTLAMKSVLDEALRTNKQVRHVIVFDGPDATQPQAQPRDIPVQHLTSASSQAPIRELPAEQAALLMYTSGTTGLPKGAVHTHCGLGIKIGQDARLSLDLKAGERMLWPTDFGWFGGTVTVLGCLSAGATLVIAEGAPTFPDVGRLWRLIERHRVTHFGTAPTLARLLRRDAEASLAEFDLSSLRVIPSSGEAWDTESWSWVMQKVGGGRAPIMNFSGGTEMCAIVASNILFPQKPGSFNGPVPGVGGDIVRMDGTSVGVDEQGELVMRQACIGTTRGLWNDEERYLDSYWRQIPGLWVQGDLASRDPDGYWFLHGRSDDTMKVSGKRVGPTEIENAVIASGKVSEVAAVAIPDSIQGSAIICVAVTAPGIAATNELAAELRDRVASVMGVSFRPRRVVFVPDLPKTRSMKVMRRIIRTTLSGTPSGDLSSLVNPEALAHLAELVPLVKEKR